MITEKAFEDIVFFPNSEKEGQYFYYSTVAGAQKDGDGGPMVSLIGAGENWFLIVSSVWQTDSLSLESLTKKLIMEKKISDASSLKLAPIEIKQAELILITQEEEKVLSTSTTSGYYPFSAAFNAMINTEQQKLIAPAFTGQKGTLIVQYTGLLNISNPIKMNLSGSPDAMLKKQSIVDSIETFSSEVRNALKDGSWLLTVDGDYDADSDEVLTLKDELIEKAANEISKMYKEKADMSEKNRNITVESDRNLITKEEIVVRGDVSTWFKDNGTEYINIIK